MSAASFPRLVGDVGGTHARFAWVASAGERPARSRTYRCADYAGIEQALAAYRQDEALPAPRACALGLANPVQGDRIEMTNNAWSFSRQALAQDLGVEQLLLLNDFTALALALPALPADELVRLGGGSGLAGKPLALLGAGTGLGASGLIPTGAGAWTPISGEGGHATLPATTDEQADVLAWLRGRFGHASAERALSGPGLVNLYEACCARDGVLPASREPQAVVARALAGDDAQAVAAAGLFWDFMGSVAGNLALTLGALGGVYLGGGLGPRLLPCLDLPRFRRHFEGKGRFAAYLAPLPCWLIRSEESPALLGANRALDAVCGPDGTKAAGH